jgi:hypothetical protein
VNRGWIGTTGMKLMKENGIPVLDEIKAIFDEVVRIIRGDAS